MRNGVGDASRHGGLGLNSDRLRLARLTAGLTLEDLGARVGTSRQFVHQLETGAKEPSNDLLMALASALDVAPNFLTQSSTRAVREEDCHFRKLASAPRGLVAQTIARGTMIEMLVDSIEERVRLPAVDFPEAARPASLDDIESIAERAREHWGLGKEGPVTNMMRVVENAGAIVVAFDDLTDRIDALSMARRRPIIVRSSAKTAAVRLRFDLSHEIAHLIMHQGIATGDSTTEAEAHRFAGAFLIPRTAFAREFPRRRRQIDWNALYAMKLRWKVSVRAIIRRAFDLGLIDAAQYRTANIHLVKGGQAKAEKYDDALACESPELLAAAVAWLARTGPAELRLCLDKVGLLPLNFTRLTGLQVPDLPDGVIPFVRPNRR